MAHLCACQSFVGQDQFHHSQALVERETCRSSMPVERVVLGGGRIQTKFEGSVAAHLTSSVPLPTDKGPVAVSERSLSGFLDLHA